MRKINYSAFKIASFDKKINRGAARVQLSIACVSLVLALFGVWDYAARFDGSAALGKILFIAVAGVFFFAALANYIEIKKYTPLLCSRTDWTLEALMAHTKKNAAKTAAAAGRVLAAGFTLDAASYVVTNGTNDSQN
jgi:hypothetical protein